MIDRSRPLPPFTRPWFVGAAIGSAIAWAAVPALGLVVLLLGGMVSGLLWLVIGVSYALVAGLVVGGLIAILGGFGSLSGAKRDEGCGLIVCGVVGIVLGNAVGPFLAPVRLALHGAGDSAAGLGWSGASVLVGDVWIGWNLVVWGWLPLIGALLASGALLLAIGLLRLHDWSLGPLRRIHLACAHGHRGGAAFACPSCGASEANLSASIHGVLHASCTCGAELPTSAINGRTRLQRRCRLCERALDHPDLGVRAEYHVAVWGSDGAAKRDWLRDALAAAAREGGRIVGAVAEAGEALPARLVALGGPGRRLLYLYDVPAAACQGGEHAAASDEYQRWLDGVLLVLPADRARLGHDQALANLFDRWDRLHPGRSRSHHRAGVAVVVPGPISNGDPRATLEASGCGPALLAIESRFRHVAYFPLDSNPVRPLAWFDGLT